MATSLTCIIQYMSVWIKTLTSFARLYCNTNFSVFINVLDIQPLA